jgi:hypothetical protein
MLGRSLVERCDNVNITIANLAQRLHAITAAVPAVILEAA